MKKILACIIAGVGWTAASGQVIGLNEGTSYEFNFASSENFHSGPFYQTPGISFGFYFDPLSVQLNERMRIELFRADYAVPFWLQEINVPQGGTFGLALTPEFLQVARDGADKVRLTMLSGDVTLTGAGQHVIYTMGDWDHDIWYSESFNRKLVLVPEPESQHILVALACLLMILRIGNVVKV